MITTVATDTLTMTWDAPLARAYGARGKDCRYGWNIDPNDENQWTTWGTVQQATPHALGAGEERFYIQCRDDIDQVSRGMLVVQHATTQRRR